MSDLPIELQFRLAFTAGWAAGWRSHRDEVPEGVASMERAESEWERFLAEGRPAALDEEQ
jgi:hypothetical protein